MQVDALSSSANNARQIRDKIMALPQEPGAPRLVLIGYSKGAPDILEAIVTYPEIRSRVAAVVSVAGAVGARRSPTTPSSTRPTCCSISRARPANRATAARVESLRPAVRRAWLAQNPLPSDVRYYSLVTFPQPERISSILQRATTSCTDRRAQRQPDDLL